MIYILQPASHPPLPIRPHYILYNHYSYASESLLFPLCPSVPCAYSLLPPLTRHYSKCYSPPRNPSYELHHPPFQQDPRLLLPPLSPAFYHTTSKPYTLPQSPQNRRFSHRNPPYLSRSHLIPPHPISSHLIPSSTSPQHTT